MKAVILAAGMGTRLKPLTNNLPKAFLPINGKPLIHYSLDNLKSVGITDIIIVLGFMESYFKKNLGETYNGINIEYLVNKEFKTTGSMHSLAQTEGINDDIILLESDLLYEKKALDTLVDSKHKDLILVAKASGSGDEAFICTNEANKIIDLGKNISNKNKKKAIGELVGISKFSKSFLNLMIKKSKEDYKKGKKNYHYEECAFATSKKNHHPIFALFCKDLTWVEIDTNNDLTRAKEEVFPEL